VDWRDLIPGVIGSFVGVMGWLVVGIYIQRRQFMRQARNAAKAVYFELDVNRATIAVAREHGLFTTLDRSSFERLLPELATLLRPVDLRPVVDAYMAHAGYGQLSSREELPDEVRQSVLGTLLDVHDRALAQLQARAFTRAEAKAIGAVGPSVGGDARSTVMRSEP
jgi:hypothetical protein